MTRPARTESERYCQQRREEKHEQLRREVANQNSDKPPLTEQQELALWEKPI